MNCAICGRILQPDSRYCDFCGTKTENIDIEEEANGILNKQVLLKWILISAGITVIITFIASGLGFPLIFGGLFLPFFFKKKHIN